MTLTVDSDFSSESESREVDCSRRRAYQNVIICLTSQPASRLCAFFFCALPCHRGRTRRKRHDARTPRHRCLPDRLENARLVAVVCCSPLETRMINGDFSIHKRQDASHRSDWKHEKFITRRTSMASMSISDDFINQALTQAVLAPRRSLIID